MYTYNVYKIYITTIFKFVLLFCKILSACKYQLLQIRQHFFPSLNKTFASITDNIFENLALSILIVNII